MKRIGSRDNPTFRLLRTLARSTRERRKTGRTILDGAHLVAAFLDHGGSAQLVAVSERGCKAPAIARLLERVPESITVLLDDVLFAAASPVDTPAGILALIAVPAPCSASPPSATCVVLDAIQDAGNIGSILRTVAAAGVAAVLLTPGCAQAWSPKVLRAGMGAHFALSIVEHADVPAMLGGFPGRIIAAVPRGASSLYATDLRGPVAWLFGSEGGGLSRPVAALAETSIAIPMSSRSESLNVAAAAAVCLFEQVRQQRSADT